MTKSEAKQFIKSLLNLREGATDEQANEAPAVYPTWKENVEYKVGDRVLYEGTLYKVITGHTSQTEWTPLNAISLFAKILIPDKNLVFPWEQPESTNPYMKDDKVLHNGKTWISIVDNNVWEPGVYGWEEVL